MEFVFQPPLFRAGGPEVSRLLSTGTERDVFERRENSTGPGVLRAQRALFQ